MHPSGVVERHAYRPDGLRRERSFPVNGIAEPVVLNEGEEDGQVGITARKMAGTTSYYQVQVVLGSGADQPLSVSLDAGLFTITLGTDSSGNPDATKNTAALVAAALASHPEVSALASGDGSASLTAAEGPYSLGVLTHFLWDGVNVLEEADANLLPAAHYTDYPGEWGGLASMWRDEESHFYGFDLQSSSRILVSVGGDITDSYAYKAFGEQLAAGLTVNPYRYVGEYGYYGDDAFRAYVRARHLDVVTGRWFSRDPIGPSLEFDAYLYASNDPHQWADPSGLRTMYGGVDYEDEEIPESGKEFFAPRVREVLSFDYWRPQFLQEEVTDEELRLILDRLSWLPVVGQPATAAMFVRYLVRGELGAAAGVALWFIPFGKVLRPVGKWLAPATGGARQRIWRFIRALPGTRSRQLLRRPLVRIARLVARPSTIQGWSSREVRQAYLGVLAINDLRRLQRPGFLSFRGVQVRAVHSLDHMPDDDLLLMLRRGTAGTTRPPVAEALDLHHFGQVAPTFYVEIADSRHYTGHLVQHPFGWTAGAGVGSGTPARRQHDRYRVAYWSARAAEELARRCQGVMAWLRGCALKRLGFLR